MPTTTQQRALDALMAAALERILADKNLNGDQHSQLKKVCESALGDMHHAVADGSQQESTKSDINKYLVPLRLACLSKTTTIARTALDCLQALITNKTITSSSLTMDRIVEILCACASDLKNDENVQNQLVIALLTVLSGPGHLMSKITVFLAVRMLGLLSKSMNKSSGTLALSKVAAITQQSLGGVVSRVRNSVNRESWNPWNRMRFQGFQQQANTPSMRSKI